jgi:hypothetical protein
MRQTYIKKGEGHPTIRRPLRIVKENAYEFAILSGNGNLYIFFLNCMFKKQNERQSISLRSSKNPSPSSILLRCSTVPLIMRKNEPQTTFCIFR